MTIDLSEFRAIFFDEVSEHLASMEAALLALEHQPGDAELINQVFRAAHSIKGGSGTFGFADLLRFTHALESLLHLLRDGKLTFDGPLADVLLRSTDALRSLVDSTRAGLPPPASLDGLLIEIAAAAAHGSAAAPEQARPAAGCAEPAVIHVPVNRVVRVVFAPGRDLLRRGMDPLLVVRDLVELGQPVEVLVDTTALPSIDELDPESCHLAWTVTMATSRSDADLRDVFAFVEDGSQIEIATVGAPEADRPAGPAPAGPGAQATAQPKVVAAAVRAAAAPEHSTVRVDTVKIDKLIDLVGELVIAQSMVTAALHDGGAGADARLRAAVLAMDRNTRELQDRVMAVRMVPVGSVFNRFPRMVRDLGASLGKQIELVITGEDIELDKGMVEKLTDPLTHLVRNAVDHGIESPEDRRAAGKPEHGTLSIVAAHQGGSVVIEVVDDGRGLDLARIRDKARARGLLPGDSEPTVEQLHDVIFMPGFSTKDQVTDTSGRGVGMDVVKSNVQALSGSLSFTSEAGQGSRMRIRLPLTMAIIDGLTLRIGEQVFVLPLIEVVESLRPAREQYQTLVGRGEIIRVRDRAVPLVRLHDVLGVAGAERDPCSALVCIVESGGGAMGLLVDDILGQAQVVVKTLETNFRRIDGVMGATILGDGRVALILDVHAVTRRSNVGASQEREAHHGAAGRAA